VVLGARLYLGEFVAERLDLVAQFGRVFELEVVGGGQPASPTAEIRLPHSTAFTQSDA
jgi:hypothetical protein